MRRRGDEDELVDLTWWPERPDVGTGGELQHTWLIDVTDKDLDRDAARARDAAWDRTGYGFRP